MKILIWFDGHKDYLPDSLENNSQLLVDLEYRLIKGDRLYIVENEKQYRYEVYKCELNILEPDTLEVMVKKLEGDY